MKLRFRNVAYAAPVESRALWIRQSLPLAVVLLGVMLTAVWVILLSWVPIRLVATAVQLALGDTFSAAFAAVP